MDVPQLVNLFQGTMDPSLREEAESKLSEVSQFPGFMPVLLQMVMSKDMQLQVRQAAVIYLKNLIGQAWRPRDSSSGAEEPKFVLPEQDQQTIRENIVESVIGATELIRVQLTVCVSEILSCDFPGNWSDVLNKLSGYLGSENQDSWLGSLIVLYQIVKKYEFKHKNERGPIMEIMQVFLPILHSRCLSVIKDESALATNIQTQILKIFRGLIQIYLPLDLINENNIPQWLGVLKTILERPVPQETLQWDEDDRPSLPWWKCKKWAVTILYKIFERYGCPGSVANEYNNFADFYDKHFSETMTQVMLKILDSHRQKQYIAPRVLQQTLNYVSQGVVNARAWKVLKPHILAVIKEIIFPLMCHTEEDEALWQDDPHEFIKIKYDIFEDFLYLSPNAAAKSLLQNVTKKRKGVLPPTVDFLVQIFNTPPEHQDPRNKDGALHMVGALADILSKKKAYKDHMEGLLVQHVFPEFQSPHGFLRARACWVVQQFAVIQFKDKAILGQTISHVMNCLANDKDLPVQVEAGIAIRYIIEHQEEASEGIKPHVKVLVQQLLRILRETENEELTGAISKLIHDFSDEVSSIAVELTTGLCSTFMELVESEEDYDSKSVTALGVLETIQTIVAEMDESKEIMAQLENIVSGLCVAVLQKEYMEFYEEIFSLINECTVVQVSPTMWNMLFLIYDTFRKDAADYFTEMMPCLHNFVTVDPPAFVGNPKYMEIIVEMCKEMLLTYSGEGAQCQAAKLLEVIVLQYQGELDQVLPTFISIALERLTKEVKTSELRVMCLQVVIACLYNNAQLTVAHLEKMQFPDTLQPVTAQFLSQWLKDTDCFLGLHDRKTFVLGMCALISLRSETRPPAVNMFASQFLPALILIFNGLRKSYEKLTGDGDDEEEDGDEDEDELESSDDEFDEESKQYCEMLDKQNAKARNEATYDEDDDDFESDLDIFTTPIDENPYVDEFISFSNAFQTLQSQDPNLYKLMTDTLSKEQIEQVQGILDEAGKKQHALESRQIEEQGGYKFTVTSIPSSFRFGQS